MDETEATRIIGGLRSDLKFANEQLGAAQSRVLGLQKLIEGLEVLYPNLTRVLTDAPQSLASTVTFQSPQGEKATGAVRRILQSQPERWFNARDMMEAFVDQGIDGTETAIRLALKASYTKGFADMRKETRGQEFRIRAEDSIAEVYQ